MGGLYLFAKPLFRRVELLNTLSLVALGLLLWKPNFLSDSSFQLSFLAAGVIAGLALPWIERTSAPYLAGLAHLGDTTRDVAYPPRVAQFRIEARATIAWLSARLPQSRPTLSSILVKWPARGALWLWNLALLSLAIQIGMLPLLAQDFHRVSLAGPLSNIPAVLLTGLIIPVGFLALGFSFVSMRLAAIFARVVGFLSAALLHVIEWFAHFPQLSYRIPGPPFWLAVAFLLALAILAAVGRSVTLFRRIRTNRRRLPPPIALVEWISGATVIALGALIASYPFSPRLEHNKTEMTILDVGQGDSIFAAFPDGRTMLVDGGGLTGSEWIKGMQSGPDVGEEVVSPYLWSRGLKSLDVVAVTHGHHDHIGGLASVLQNFSVGELWIGRDEESPEFNRLIDEARERGVRIVHKNQGDEISWDDVHGRVLWPPQEQPARGASNDDSLVMRIEDGGSGFLLTGDIEQREERLIVASGGNLPADLLKVPHHGSKTSSTLAFLTAVQPRVAVISVGAGNEYGHPSPEVVERYDSNGVQLLRTDRDGAVTALSDGRNLLVSGSASAPRANLLSISPRTSAGNVEAGPHFR